MATLESNGILPLEALDLRAVPLTTHNLAWSPDAELAVASDDCVYIYLPEFPSKTVPESTAPGEVKNRRQYYEIALRFPIVELRRPELNQPLFDTVKQDFPDVEPAWESGQSIVSNMGNSMNHAVAIEWSPNGLGRMRRSVLGVLTGSGSLTIYCEGTPVDKGGGKVRGRNIRSITSWVVPWGVGGNLLLPRAKGYSSPYSRERITSFSWARDLDRNGGLLAYMNDEDEIAIVAVQSRQSSEEASDEVVQWKVEEMARFAGDGPHESPEPHDPDYLPFGSSFALQWSPWLHRQGHKTAILAYVTKNYVGFRQVYIKGTWRSMQTPEVEVGPLDCGGICLHLSPDAFVIWEDLIWTKGVVKECRGLIATPMTIESFAVPFEGKVANELAAKHTLSECNTTYPPAEDAQNLSNPITGLVIHPADISKTTESPYFSLTRLAATSTNTDWYQSNLPLPSNPEESDHRPPWASQISDILNVTEPFSLAYRYQNPYKGVAGTLQGSDDEGSDQEDANEEDDDSEEEEDDSDDENRDGSPIPDLADPFEGMEKLHTTRIRVWGMAASPGGGVTAVFTTLSSAIKPERHTFAGLKCKIFFGETLAKVDEALLLTKKLSTEARTFEWMYGGGPPVKALENASRTQGIRTAFRDVTARQTCVFCGEPLKLQDSMFKCSKHHTFEQCAATGLPILAPGVSNICGVCGFKCLKPGEIVAMAGDEVLATVKQISSEFCGGCGGRFVNQ